MEADSASSVEEQSKRLRKRKTPRHMSNIDLRPCEVCGGKASGFHFGAITCEACKSFFRRTMKSSLAYSCFRQEEGQPCVIRLVKGGVAPCPACRYKRCQELNMSMDAVKKGRYTHRKKAEAINRSREYWNTKSKKNKQDVTDPESKENLCTSTSTLSPLSSSSVTSSSLSAASPSSVPTSPSTDASASLPSTNSTSSMSSSSMTSTSSDDYMDSENDLANDLGNDLGNVTITDINQMEVGSNRCPCGLDFNAIMAGKIDLLQYPLMNPKDASTTHQGALQLACNDAQAQELPCHRAAARLGELRCNGLQTEAFKCNGLQGFSGELPRESNCPKSGCNGETTSMCPMMFSQALNGVQNLPSGSCPQDLPSGSCPQCPEIEKQLKTDIANSACLTEDILALGVFDEDTHMKEITESVTTAYDQQKFLTKSFLSKVSYVQYKHMREKEFKKQMFGNLPDLHIDEYKNLLDETGIDIDGRLESVQGFCLALEAAVRKFVSFMMAIPGFQLLSPQDQVSMVRNNNVVLMETVYYPCHNLESGVVANPFQGGRVCIENKHKSTLIGVDRCANELMKPIVQHLQDLELTDQENALMSSVCVMHPDACATDDGKTKCSIIHNKLYRALKKLLCRRCGQEEATRMMAVVENDICEKLHRCGVPYFSQQWGKVVNTFGRSLSIPGLVLEWLNVG